MAPKTMSGKVEFRDNLAGDVWLIRIHLDEEVHFFPGQYVSVKVSEKGERRSYSVASSPSNGEKRSFIDLLIDVSPGGVGSKYFLGLSKGDVVELMGFLGRFYIQEEWLEQNQEILFVVTGTGIAPIKPMIENLLVNKNFKGKIRLIWGMRFEGDLYWVEEFERLSRNHDNFEFDLVLSSPTERWLGKKGHVGDIVKELGLTRKKILAFLCGAPQMIEDMRELLMVKDIEEQNIFYEKYY